MRIGFLPLSNADAVHSRLTALNVPQFRMEPVQVQELTHESADMVYLLPFEVVRQAEWNQLRVRLAQANRRFLMAGASLSTAQILEAVNDGAYDVLDTDRDDAARWLAAFDSAVMSQQVWMQLYGGAAVSQEQALSGASIAICTLRQAVDKLGPTDVSVLILGESGVGKEKVAQALHQASRRKNFVAINCAAIPKDLLEAELFGVEKGAFTGAVKARAGLVEQAADGTIFLDEIGEMDLTLQPKLLRYLETRRARRVGGESEYRSGARVVAATNRALLAEAEAGRFRLDLYYRLAEIILQVPPLRERREDIPPLAHIFLRLANERFGKNIEYCEPALVQRFMQYHWPGNARELKGTIDRLVLLHDGPILREGWWENPAGTAAPVVAPTPSAEPPPSVRNESSDKSDQMNRQQKFDLARRLLAESANNHTWVANQIGVNATTLWRWRKLGKI